MQSGATGFGFSFGDVETEVFDPAFGCAKVQSDIVRDMKSRVKHIATWW
jgi:hypothetical protein